MKGLRILLRPPNRNNFPHLPPNQKFRPIRGMPASGFRGPWMLWIVDFTEWAVPAAFVVYGAGKYGAGFGGYGSMDPQGPPTYTPGYAGLSLERGFQQN